MAPTPVTPIMFHGCKEVETVSPEARAVSHDLSRNVSLFFEGVQLLPDSVQIVGSLELTCVTDVGDDGGSEYEERPL